MNPGIAAFEKLVTDLTAPGQPFELNTVEVGSASYRNYASAPQNLGTYFSFMLNHAGKDFAVYRDERYTFEQAYENASAFAAALQQHYGVVPGDRVAIVSRNNPQWMMAFIAIVSIGAVAVPMNAWWTTEELQYGLADSGSVVVVADRQRMERLVPLADALKLKLISVEDCADLPVDSTPFAQLCDDFAGTAMPSVEVAPDDYATIMYTSGSTGHPKGAVSSHRGIIAALYSWLLMGTASKMLAPADDGEGAKYPPSGLLAVPLFHCTASHSAFMLSIIVGRKLVIMYKWDAEEALRLVEQERITWFTGVPTMSAEMQAAAEHSDRDLSSLAEIFAGGAARPPEQVKKIANTFKKATPGIGYGLTETNALGAFNSGPFYLEKPTSTGRAVPAVTDFKVIDANGDALPAGERGELCIYSPANGAGYWNKPEATAEAFIDGWFHTGDVAYMDEDGFIYIVDRIKEIIIRGGENISCLEVEAAIYSHPAVFEAAVFGLPDERLGESVGCCIVLHPGQNLSRDALHQHLQQHLAAFKIPQHVFFTDEQLPRIASGKIFKRQLKQDYAEQLA